MPLKSMFLLNLAKTVLYGIERLFAEEWQWCTDPHYELWSKSNVSQNSG